MLWALGGAQAGALIGLGSSFVLARLLQPHDTGTFAMAAVLVALANLFRDFGVGTYIVQEPDLTPAKLRAALGIALVTAWSMALSLWLGSQPFASLMGEAGIVPVLRVLALNFVLIPFGSVAYSLLRRQMAFRTRAYIETAGIVGQAGASIVLATGGLGATSLAWGSLANVAITVIGTSLARPAGMPWRPSLRGVAAVLQFGAPTSLAMMLRYLSDAMPTLLTGRGLGAAELGLLHRAQGFAQLLQGVAQGPAGNVMLPALGAVSRQQAQVGSQHPFVPAYVHATTLVAGLALPFALTAILMAEPLIHLLYGPSWQSAATLVLPLACAALVGVPNWFANDMLMAAGRPRVAAGLELLGILLLVTALLGALPHGLLAVSWAVFAAGVTISLVRLRWLSRHFDISWRDHWACWRPTIPPTLAIVPVLIVGHWASRTGAASTGLTLSVLILVAGVYILAMRIGRHAVWRELLLVANRKDV